MNSSAKTAFMTSSGSGVSPPPPRSAIVDNAPVCQDLLEGQACRVIHRPFGQAANRLSHGGRQRSHATREEGRCPEPARGSGRRVCAAPFHFAMLPCVV